jgi:hypothetical protein
MFIGTTSVRYITERRDVGTVSLNAWIFVQKLLLGEVLTQIAIYIAS